MCERVKGKSAKVQGLSLAEGIFCKKKTGRRPAWKVDVHVGRVYRCIKATTGEVILRNPNGVWLTRMVRRKKRWERSNLEMIVAVPWRKNEDDAKHGRRTSQRRDGGTCSGAKKRS